MVSPGRRFTVTGGRRPGIGTGAQMDSEPLDTREAFRPNSGYFGWMVTPAVEIDDEQDAEPEEAATCPSAND